MTKLPKEFKKYVKEFSKRPAGSTMDAIFKNLLRQDVRHNNWRSSNIGTLWRSWNEKSKA